MPSQNETSLYVRMWGILECQAAQFSNLGLTSHIWTTGQSDFSAWNVFPLNFSSLVKLPVVAHYSCKFDLHPESLPESLELC